MNPRREMNVNAAALVVQPVREISFDSFASSFKFFMLPHHTRKRKQPNYKTGMRK